MDAIDRASLSLDGLSVGDATAPDTRAPLCLWIAAHASRGFEPALWHTVSALGDRDTTCSIVGGLLALRTGRLGIAQRWLQSREKLPIGLPSSRVTPLHDGRESHGTISVEQNLPPSPTKNSHGRCEYLREQRSDPASWWARLADADGLAALGFLDDG